MDSLPTSEGEAPRGLRGAGQAVIVAAAAETASGSESVVRLDDQELEERADVPAPGGLCACGCGEPAVYTVMRLPEWERGTAEALGWNEELIRSLREPVHVAWGHGDQLRGYVPALG